MYLQEQKPFFVFVQPHAAHGTTFGDVVIGAIGITGVLVATSCVLGVLLGLVFVAWQRRHPAENDHLPPVV